MAHLDSSIQHIHAALARLTNPDDEAQLEQLDKAIGELRVENCGPHEFNALLNVFERFPDHDGYGIFWSIVHLLEGCTGYEPMLIESVKRKPVTFNVLMINRMLNGGVNDVAGESLMALLATVASNSAAPDAIRGEAQHFLGYQAARPR